MKHAVLLPGFNGQARQPILLKLATALEALGYQCSLPGLPKGRPSPGFVREVAFLRAVIVDAALERPLLVGRSYGGRVAVRYALEHPVTALVLLGFPVRPPSGERPEDEAALCAVAVPTLVLQGSVDDKGPLEVFTPLLAANRHLELSVLEGAGHSLGRQEREALLRASAFVRRVDARDNGFRDEVEQRDVDGARLIVARRAAPADAARASPGAVPRGGGAGHGGRRRGRR